MATGTLERYAWRLTFAYDGDKFTLKSTRRLAKRVPPGQPLDTNRAGRFIELRSPERQILYRRAITELLADTIEYPTGNPDQPLGRAPAPRRGEIALLVPDLPDSDSVAIVDAVRAGGTGRRTRQRGAEDSESTIAPRDLIAVELPREGGEK